MGRGTAAVGRTDRTRRAGGAKATLGRGRGYGVRVPAKRDGARGRGVTLIGCAEGDGWGGWGKGDTCRNPAGGLGLPHGSTASTFPIPVARATAKSSPPPMRSCTTWPPPERHADHADRPLGQPLGPGVPARRSLTRRPRDSSTGLAPGAGLHTARRLDCPDLLRCQGTNCARPLRMSSPQPGVGAGVSPGTAACCRARAVRAARRDPVNQPRSPSDDSRGRLVGSAQFRDGDVPGHLPEVGVLSWCSVRGRRCAPGPGLPWTDLRGNRYLQSSSADSDSGLGCRARPACECPHATRLAGRRTVTRRQGAA